MHGNETLENACTIRAVSSGVQTKTFRDGIYALFLLFLAITRMLPEEQLNWAVNALNIVSMVEEYVGLNQLMVNNALQLVENY